MAGDDLLDDVPPLVARLARPLAFERRPTAPPSQALSGDETRRRMEAVNADRNTVQRIMTAPSRVFGEPQPTQRAAGFAPDSMTFSACDLGPYADCGYMQARRR